MTHDYLFRGTLSDYDPEVHKLSEIEAERQFRRLILIPSESTVPLAVRESLSGPFHNIYAEGYPPESTRWMTEEEILNYDDRLAEYRRYSDPRYYKGVEYADIIEALARRRAAEAYAANGLTADDLYVNVQALSGGPANNAVYHALVQPGDTVMGMDLIYGGHLSHGSPVNRSGKYYNIVSYAINPETGLIDYEDMRELALKHKPKMIIGGYSSYPWQADWAAYRAIADEVGAYLLADISHVSGLIVTGQYPSPIGYADVVTTTTHKTLNGPRGAMIITSDGELSKKIDRAVFPGEQGGPHINVFAALATALKISQTDQFRNLQIQTIKNCVALSDRLEERGFAIPYGGTNTHLTNLDCKSVKGPDGTALSGDMAARILDLAGIVVNRNTIPGDRSALNPSGIRLGTTWVTQRGFTEEDSIKLADVIADLLQGCMPYQDPSVRRRGQRAKVNFTVLQDARSRVSKLAEHAGIDYEPANHGYPHFPHREIVPGDVMDWATFSISGPKARAFLNVVIGADIEMLEIGHTVPTFIYTPDDKLTGTLHNRGEQGFILQVAAKKANMLTTWLRDLSDGYIEFEKDELLRKIPGPVSIKRIGVGIRENETMPKPDKDAQAASPTKPYFIGIQDGTGAPLPKFTWKDPGENEVKETPLHDTHVDMGAKMVPFGGWDMPVWYTSIKEEHNAVRTTAGLFDVSHMGVYQAEGPDAAIFLDSVCANYIGGLSVGQSVYTHFLDPDANVIDDLLVYRRELEKYLVVVNASNDDKDWAWLNAVKNGSVRVDKDRPWALAFGRNVILRNLRDVKEGPDMKVDLALQGPRSFDILLSMDMDSETRKRIKNLQRTELCEAIVDGFDLVVSRTGYTGESVAFELFVHPEEVAMLWNSLLDAGSEFGLAPVGLGARDSLRTEAGLPLYGQEMGGKLNLGVGEAGFGSYAKVHKPWFIGRSAFLAREKKRSGKVVRFRFDEQRVRLAHLGDPVLDKRGRTIGVVTSCAIDKDDYYTGQAYIENKSNAIGTPIYIYQSAAKNAGKAPAALRLGDRTNIPAPAAIVRRFPRL